MRGGLAQAQQGTAGIPRLALPSDQLRPGRHRRPRVPEDHGHAHGTVHALRHPPAADLVVPRTPATSRRPTTCRPTRRSTTTRSPTRTSPACIASLSTGRTGTPRSDDHRLQPGRHVRRRPHPAGAAHVPRRLLRHRRVHASTRSSCRRRSPARWPASPTRRSIACWSSPRKSGLVVILHSDIDIPFAKQGAEPVYLAQMKTLLEEHPKAPIIWAHVGLGRIVHPVQSAAAAAERSPGHLGLIEEMLIDPALAHVHFDISWDEVAKYVVASPEATAQDGRDPQQVPGRGFCSAPTRWRRPGRRRTSRCSSMYAPLWKALTPEASRQVRIGNYERLFDEGRRRVREWERRRSEHEATSNQQRRIRLTETTDNRMPRPGAASGAGRGTRFGTARLLPTGRRMDIYGFAMLDMGLNFKTIDPELVRHDARQPAAVLRRGVRRGRQHVRRRPSEPARRQGLRADRDGRTADHVRVRNVRHRRRRGPDDVPAAPRLRRARPVRRRASTGARSWTSTCSRTRSSTGDRPAWCSSATSRCARCRSRATRA